MEKGQLVRCVESKRNYLSTGRVYVVTAGVNCKAKPFGCRAFVIESDTGFTVNDDQGDSIFQHSLIGSHGTFELLEVE